MKRTRKSFAIIIANSFTYMAADCVYFLINNRNKSKIRGDLLGREFNKD